MNTSEEGIELIKQFEGLKLRAYPDPGTGGAPWTIGHGHAIGVQPGDEITEEQARQLLKDDLAKVEECVTDACKVELTQGQFDACVSLAYNIGCEKFRGSTLLKLLNAGEIRPASQQFARWNKANGREMSGLSRRREAERQRFLG